MALSAVNKRSGYEKDGTPSTIFGDAYTHFDLGCVAQTFCLAAHDEGIGTCLLYTSSTCFVTKKYECSSNKASYSAKNDTSDTTFKDVCNINTRAKTESYKRN